LKQAEIDEIEANTEKWLRGEFKIDFTVNLSEYNTDYAGCDAIPKERNQPAKAPQRTALANSSPPNPSPRKTILIEHKVGKRDRKRKKSSDQRDLDEVAKRPKLKKKKDKTKERPNKSLITSHFGVNTSRPTATPLTSVAWSSENELLDETPHSSAPSPPAEHKEPELPQAALKTDLNQIANIKKEPIDYISLVSDDEEEEQVSASYIDSAMQLLAKSKPTTTKMVDMWSKSTCSDIDEIKSAKVAKTSIADDTNKYKRFDIHIKRPNQLFDKKLREDMKEEREERRNVQKKRNYELSRAEASVVNAIGNNRKTLERKRNYAKDDFIKVQQQHRVLDKKLYGNSSCSALQYSAARADDDTIFIAKDVIDRVYPSKNEYRMMKHVGREEHAQMIDNIEGRGIYARDRAKTEAINANLDKRLKLHEYIQLFATKAKPKSKSALKTPETEKAESAKKRVQQEQQRSLNALRPTPSKEPPRANRNRPTITSPPTATPVTPLARPLSCQVNSQLDPRRRPSSSSSNPVSLPVHPSVLDLLKDKTKENERPRLNFRDSSGESEDENDLANILK